jgi:hypothetical protein
MTTSENIWLAMGVGGAAGAQIGSLLGDIASFMALGFIAGIGTALFLLSPRNADRA